MKALRFTLILFLVALATQWVVAYSGWFANPPPASMSTIIFMFGLTTLAFRMVCDIRDRHRFTQMYILTITIKMLVTCIVIVVLIVGDKPNARANVVFLLILYAIFTTIEVGFLLSAVRTNH